MSGDGPDCVCDACTQATVREATWIGVAVNPKREGIHVGGRVVAEGNTIATVGLAGQIERDGVTAWPGEDETWTVSDGGGWLPGVYESEEAARAAVELGYDAIVELNSICHIDGENRPITMADVAAHRRDRQH